MLRIGVACTQAGDSSAAQQLAQTLQLPLVSDRQGQSDFDYHLWIDAQGLSLQPAPGSALTHGPIRARLHGTNIQRRSQGGRRNPLARALGLYGRVTPSTMLDATAGLGRDAAVAAALGLRVDLLERHPVIHALLADACQRLPITPDCGRLQLLPRADAADILRLHVNAYDVLYLDPMFPSRGKTALARKEMQTLRWLLDETQAADIQQEQELLQLALNAARQRVVVKRHAHSPDFAGVGPSHCIGEARVRYDIYLSPSAPG